MKRTRKFLAASLGAILVLCTAVFLWITSYLRETSNDAIRDIGMIYMSEMSIQLKQKFDAITELYLSQVEGIVRRTPPGSVSYGEEFLEELSLGSRIRAFDFLGLYPSKQFFRSLPYGFSFVKRSLIAILQKYCNVARII